MPLFTRDSGAIRVMSRSVEKTWPPVIVTSPMTVWRNEVLPAPLAPRIVTISPGMTWMSIPRSTRLAP